jgi:hypothetical protein
MATPTTVAIDRLADATERIAAVAERIEVEADDSARLTDILRIFDGWHNPNAMTVGDMRQMESTAHEALRRIGDVLYRRKGGT